MPGEVHGRAEACGGWRTARRCISYSVVFWMRIRTEGKGVAGREAGGSPSLAVTRVHGAPAHRLRGFCGILAQTAKPQLNLKETPDRPA